jgi:hypothetical protein
MEPEASLPCSQEPSTGTYSEPDESSPYHVENITISTVIFMTPVYGYQY